MPFAIKPGSRKLSVFTLSSYGVLSVSCGLPCLPAGFFGSLPVRLAGFLGETRNEQ